MKKHILIIAILLLPAFLKAQEKNFRLGFTASPTFGWMSYKADGRLSDLETPENKGLRTGFSYGVLGDFGFSKNYYFATALTITTINSKVEQSGGIMAPDASNSTTINKLQYLEIPLTLKLKSNPGNLARFYGQFGLGTGINIGAKQDYKLTVNGNVTEENKNVKIDDAKTFRMSLIVGTGAEWNIGKNMSLLTGVSLNNGFTNALSDILDNRNSYLAANIGVYF